jgi:hypothetical protein
MILTRRMLISAAAAGIIIVGGAAVAATASADRLEQARRHDQKAKTVIHTGTQTVPGRAVPDSEMSVVSPSPGYVVSHSLGADPGEIAEYWTDDRLEGAEPLPIPGVTLTPPGN